MRIMRSQNLRLTLLTVLLLGWAACRSSVEPRAVSPEFSISPDTTLTTIGATCTFELKSTASQPISASVWSFGDGAPIKIAGAIIQHQFLTKGEHKIVAGSLDSTANVGQATAFADWVAGVLRRESKLFLQNHPENMRRKMLFGVRRL